MDRRVAVLVLALCAAGTGIGHASWRSLNELGAAAPNANLPLVDEKRLNSSYDNNLAPQAPVDMDASFSPDGASSQGWNAPPPVRRSPRAAFVPNPVPPAALDGGLSPLDSDAVTIGLLGALGIGLFAFSMAQFGKGYSEMKRQDRTSRAYARIAAAQKKHGPALLRLMPGAVHVFAEQSAPESWELVVYFRDEAAMRKAPAPAPVEGVPVRKELATLESLQQALQRKLA